MRYISSDACIIVFTQFLKETSKIIPANAFSLFLNLYDLVGRV